MKRIYRVSMDVKYRGDSGFYPERVDISANGDAMKAIQKARNYFMKQTAVHTVKLREVEIRAEADV